MSSGSIHRITSSAFSFVLGPNNTMHLPCYILKLPPELRLLIYEEVMDTTSAGPKTYARRELLNTCRTFRVEAKDIYSAKIESIIARYDQKRVQLEQEMKDAYQEVKYGEKDWKDFHRADRACAQAGFRQSQARKMLRKELAWVADLGQTD